MLSYDRRSVGRSVLVSGHHLGPVSNFLSFFFEIFFGLLWVCYYAATSLTRGGVCSLQLLLGLVSAAFLRPVSHATHEHILLSLFVETPPTWKARLLYLFSPEKVSPVMPPGIGFV
jgi:hypothetical protein